MISATIRSKDSFHLFRANVNSSLNLHRPNTQCYTCCTKENCNSLEKILRKLPEGVFEAGEAEEADETGEAEGAENYDEASTKAPRRKKQLKTTTTEPDEYYNDEADHYESDKKQSEDDDAFLDELSAKVSKGEDRLENGGDVYDTEDDDEAGDKFRPVGKTATKTDEDELDNAAVKETDTTATNETDTTAANEGNYFEGIYDVNNTELDYQGDEPVSMTDPPNDLKYDVVEIEDTTESDEAGSDDAKDSSTALTASLAFTFIPIVVSIIINFIH